jgi:two-component system, cell cycle sensor histidine kinase DivJ
MAINTSPLDAKTLRRRFIAVHAAKGAVGAGLALGFAGLVGRPNSAELVAMAGLASPLLLALLGLLPVSITRLEQTGLILFAGVIGYLAALTGGVTSPLVVWFALVPAEAALAGGRSQVVRAGFAAAAAFLVVASLQASDMLPLSRLALPWEIYAISVLAALAQAVLVAAASQDRQRAADKRAAEGTAMYRFLADHAMDLITRHTADGRIRFASPASYPLLGRLPAELEGKAMATVVHPDDLAALLAAFMDALYSGKDGAVEVRLRHRDKHYLWAEIRCRPAPLDAMGGATDIVAVTRDISERKAQELALVQARDASESASRAKSAFLANMSHELRTPLNAIIGFSEVMTKEIFGPVGSPRYQEYARLIHESGGHLLELINGVLDMSKIEAGKFELYEELFDLDEVASSAIRFVSHAAERGGVAITLNIAPAARQIFADRRAVKQMLVNLVSNGVKFTPRGGKVTVTASVQDGILLSVSDTGTGISQADLEKLGKPFEQVEGAQTRAKEGTGLGLALVKALAVLHGGEMVMQSALGEGTTVMLRLPHAVVGADGTRLQSADVLPFKAA